MGEEQEEEKEEEEEEAVVAMAVAAVVASWTRVRALGPETKEVFSQGSAP